MHLKTSLCKETKAPVVSQSIVAQEYENYYASLILDIDKVGLHTYN